MENEQFSRAVPMGSFGCRKQKDKRGHGHRPNIKGRKGVKTRRKMDREERQRREGEGSTKEKDKLEKEQTSKRATEGQENRKSCVLHFTCKRYVVEAKDSARLKQGGGNVIF